MLQKVARLQRRRRVLLCRCVLRDGMAAEGTCIATRGVIGARCEDFRAIEMTSARGDSTRVTARAVAGADVSSAPAGSSSYSPAPGQNVLSRAAAARVTLAAALVAARAAEGNLERQTCCSTVRRISVRLRDSSACARDSAALVSSSRRACSPCCSASCSSSTNAAFQPAKYASIHPSAPRELSSARTWRSCPAPASSVYSRRLCSVCSASSTGSGSPTTDSPATAPARNAASQSCSTNARSSCSLRCIGPLGCLRR